VVAGALLALAHWALVIATVDFANPGLVLHYNLYFGIDRVGNWLDSLLLPGVATALVLLDVAVAAWLMKRDHWLAQATVFAGAATAALLLAVSALVRWQFR
jgi:hypothetical protein